VPVVLAGIVAHAMPPTTSAVTVLATHAAKIRDRKKLMVSTSRSFGANATDPTRSGRLDDEMDPTDYIIAKP
jgi:hypothetical protein